MSAAFAVLAPLCFTLFAAGPPQQPPPPPPPPPPPMRPGGRDIVERKGTAAIHGHVRTVDGRPLRRATVQVSGNELAQPRTASTGLEGEYELTGLPSGRYTVRVTRGGYLPQIHGQRYYGEAGSPIELADRQVLEKVDFVLERAGAVSGRVLDETGEAVAGARVELLQRQFYRGERRLVRAVSGEQTDETGYYQIGSVPPGEYVVMAQIRETWMSDGDDPQMLGYAPSYYPGTSRASDAARVKVAAGQEVAAIDITLIPGRAATLAGIATASDGTPLANASVAVNQESEGPGGMSAMAIATTRAGPDGRWRLAGVPPGDYRLRASGSAGERGTEVATLLVTVTGADMTDIVLAADPGAILAGRVVTDTGGPLPSSRIAVDSRLSIFEASALRVTIGKDDGAVGPDGRFTRRVPSGRVYPRVRNLPPGWAVARVEAGGADVTGRPLALGPRQTLADVVIVISRSLPDVTVRLVDEHGERADGTVVLYPADSRLWHEASGAVHSARPDSSGAFLFEDVRPGEYLAAAFEYVASWQVYDPELLETMRSRATRVRVEGEPVSIDVKVKR